MTTAARPVPGPAEATSGDTAQCAALELNAGLRALQPLPFLGKIVADNANAQQIHEAALAQRSRVADLHAEVWAGDPLTLARRFIPAKNALLIVGVNVTSDCVPLSGRPNDWQPRHWLVLYSTEGDTYNCWWSTFERYANLATAHNPAMGNVVLYRDSAIPVSNPVPTGGTQGINIPPNQEDQDMVMYVNTFNPQGGGTGLFLCDTRSGLLVPVNGERAKLPGVPQIDLDDAEFNQLQTQCTAIRGA